MSKLRSVDTHFWQDEYIVELDPTEKLLFLYFITNPATGMSGCYERPLRMIAFDTGIDKDMVVRIISRFERDHKIMYREGWVVLFNFDKHNNLNPSMQRAAEKELQNAPKWIHNTLSERSQQRDNRMSTACEQDTSNLAKINELDRMQTGCEQDRRNRIELNRIEENGNEKETPLSVFKEFFPETSLNCFQQDLIASEVRDMSRWRETCKFWAEQDYRGRSARNMLEKYKEMTGQVKSPFARNQEVTTVVSVDDTQACPICENGFKEDCPYHGGKKING